MYFLVNIHINNQSTLYKENCVLDLISTSCPEISFLLVSHAYSGPSGVWQGCASWWLGCEAGW
jgi:hypothetical protein